MFARLTPIILALLAIASTAAACTNVCCVEANSVSSPWPHLVVLTHVNDPMCMALGSYW
ncbi:hypothetical protein PAXINDRAFT_166476 [Paxillus involutus ATCC 200175]|nr:hypothetical protein PAXINDRAFT_166476 [Paxillus involutus ATCC 200175]